MTLYRIFGRDGEYDRDAMKELIRRGEVTSLSEVTVSGTDDWKSAGLHPELQRYLALASTSREKPQPASASTKQIAIAVLLIVVGLFFGVSGSADLVRGFSSSGWPEGSDAQIISADVVGRSSYRRSRRRSRRLKVTYRYRAAGRLYLGDRVSFGREWLTTASRQLNESRSNLHVYYNPTMPRMSVMRRGPTIGAAFAALLGFAGVAFGLLALLKPEILARIRKKAGNLPGSP